MDDDKNDFQKIMEQTAKIENHKLTDEEKKALLEKVTEKLKGKMTPMTEEEIEEFYDTRRI